MTTFFFVEMEHKPERALIHISMFLYSFLYFVEMKHKPERALILFFIFLKQFILPSSRNEAQAREGIDTTLNQEVSDEKYLM